MRQPPPRSCTLIIQRLLVKQAYLYDSRIVYNVSFMERFRYASRSDAAHSLCNVG